MSAEPVDLDAIDRIAEVFFTLECSSPTGEGLNEQVAREFLNWMMQEKGRLLRAAVEELRRLRCEIKLVTLDRDEAERKLEQLREDM